MAVRSVAEAHRSDGVWRQLAPEQRSPSWPGSLQPSVDLHRNSIGRDSSLAPSRRTSLEIEMPEMSAAHRSLPVLDDRPSFERALRDHGVAPLLRGRLRTLQVNVGKLCNMACHHCHVHAGPRRTEVMPRAVAVRLIELLARHPDVEVVDLTGGAPELNPHFRWLVGESRRLGRRVIERCNLTVLHEPGMADLPAFLAENQVEIVASLPCYGAENVEKQRGRGAFEKSIEALRTLNQLGYGRPGSALKLSLVYNPVGASLPPAQGKPEL